MEDRRCKLGLAGRLELVRLIESGCSLRAPRRLRVLFRRPRRIGGGIAGRQATEAERASRACLRTRSSRPRSCPWALSAEAEQAILTARAKTNWGPMRLTWLDRPAPLDDLEGARAPRRLASAAASARQTHRRYEWTEAGALLHIDAFELPKFDRPGHWATGERAEQHKTRRAGKIKSSIGVIDDHTRLAYCELHGAENAITVSATLRRAAAWMREQGCGPVQAVMSDNAKCYATSHAFRDTLAELGARHILIPPYTPRWNGKIERFFGTLDTEWAHGRVWPNSTRRDRALASFIRFYNRRRPHSAAGGRPPISRVHQVREQDS